MKRCIALEENHNNIIASNSMESSKIDSISLDLMHANETNDLGKCDHFTIRGYVSEIRKRDWKLCWPFALDDNDYKDRKCSLPPLSVPKFRFWCCQNCQRMIDGNTSANMHKAKEGCPSFCVDRQEKKPEFANKPIIAQNTQLEENSNQEIHGVNSSVMAAVSGMVLNTNHTDDKGSEHLADSEFLKNLDGGVTLTAAICQIGNDASLNDKEKELVPCGRSQEAGNVEEALSIDKDVMNRGPSLESECNASSSESAEVMIRNEFQDLHDDDSSCLRRRKARKVRLLTELLCKHGDGDTNHKKTENSASNAIPAASGSSPDASTGANKLPVIHNQLANQGTARKTLSQTQKRKLPQDEDWRPPETSSPNKVPKEDRFLKRDFENANAVVHSESEADASARISLQTDPKLHWSKYKIDKISTESKKENKKTMTVYESLSSLPLDKNVPVETGDKSRDDNKGSGIGGVFLELMDNSFTGREMDLFPLTAQSTERNLGYSKKQGKMPQDDDQQASIVPWNHGRPSEGPMARKDVEIIPSAPIDIPFNAVGETSGKNGLNLSLNGCMATGRHDGKYTPQAEDRETSFLAWQKTTFGDQFMRKAEETKYIGDFGFTSNTAANAPFRNGLDSNLNSKGPSYTASFINEKQNHTSQVEFGGTLMQQKDFFNTGSHWKTVGSQEHSTATKKDNGQKFDKFSEQGALDDIPMDIVELMAKNQYERCLPDAEFDQLQLATSENPKWGSTTDCGNTHGPSLFQQETTQKQKHGARNARNGTIKRAEIVGTAKEKKLDYFSQVGQNQLNISQLEQANVPAGFRTSFQHQENPLNGVQHFASSSEGKINTNCKWFGDIAGKTFHHNILQASRTCTTCHHNLQQDLEANQNLASIMPKYAPIVYNIPQKSATSCTNIDVLSCMSGAGSMHKEQKNGDHDLRFHQSAANIGKQLRNFSPDTLSRTQAEHPLPCKHNKIEPSQKPAGSLDLYSNETIPAMHLLSFFDAVRSTTPTNMEVPVGFLRRPPINHDPSPKHISRQVPGAFKASNAMKGLPCHGKNQLAGNSQDGIPAIPTTVGTSSSPRHVSNFRKASDFTAQLSLEKEKGKGSDMHFQNKDILQKSVSASCGLGSTCGSIPVHSMQKIFFGTQEPRMFPLNFRALDKSTNHKIQASSTSGTAKTHKTRPKTQICSLNRNPADFSIPNDKNEYMIKGEDLKIREGILASNGSRSVCLDVHKRPRKHPAAKEGCI